MMTDPIRKAFEEVTYSSMSQSVGSAQGYFTGRGSSVSVTFPYIKPDKPKYQFVPTEEFPNEVL